MFSCFFLHLETVFIRNENTSIAFRLDQPLPFYQKALLAGFSGACGGFVGTPGDLVNVRMQNDVKVCSRVSIESDKIPEIFF